MNQQKEESLYKVLGTTAKISDKRIKEKYIQAVKKHPPEMDPEGFEKVRRAYETLKDPEQRKQYDIQRKHGNNLRKMLEEASFEMDQANYNKAEKILKRAEQIDNNSKEIMMDLAIIAAENDDFEALDTYLSKVRSIDDNTFEQASLYMSIFESLVDKNHLEKAVYYVRKAKSHFPQHTNALLLKLSGLFMEIGETERMLKLFREGISSPEEAKEEDMYSLFSWIMVIASLDRWSEVSKIQSWYKKFIKNQSNDARKYIAELLEQQLNEVYSIAQFRVAGVYAKLIKTTGLTLGDELKEKLEEVSKLDKVQKEIFRVGKDERLFPLIYLHLFEWFYEDFMSNEFIRTGIEEIVPFEYRIILEESKEEYATGIVRLRKKYPVLYRYFKEEWDTLFEELTEDFNREMKRSLR